MQKQQRYSRLVSETLCRPRINLQYSCQAALLHHHCKVSSCWIGHVSVMLKCWLFSFFVFSPKLSQYVTARSTIHTAYLPWGVKCPYKANICTDDRAQWYLTVRLTTYLCRPRIFDSNSKRICSYSKKPNDRSSYVACSRMCRRVPSHSRNIRSIIDRATGREWSELLAALQFWTARGERLRHNAKTNIAKYAILRQQPKQYKFEFSGMSVTLTLPRTLVHLSGYIPKSSVLS